jgi:DNA polymerase/3'-5' exonuclease PolX
MIHENYFHLQYAKEVAARVCAALAPVCNKVQVAGSIRREKAKVHDVDIVCWPICDPHVIGQAGLFEAPKSMLMPVRLLALLADLAWYNAASIDFDHYPRILKLDLTSEGEEIPVELYLSEPDGSNWGALLQMRTGDERFNIMLASRAGRLNLKYKAGYGIYRGWDRMDDGTEEGIFKALGINTVPAPCKRTGEWSIWAGGK